MDGPDTKDLHDERGRIQVRARAEDLLAVLVSTHPSGYADALGAGGAWEKLRIARAFLLVAGACWFVGSALLGEPVWNDPAAPVVVTLAIVDWYLLFGRTLRRNKPAGKPRDVCRDALVQTLARLVRPARTQPVTLSLGADAWSLKAPLHGGSQVHVSAAVDGTTYLSVRLDAQSPEPAPFGGQQWPGIHAPEVTTTPGPPSQVQVRKLDMHIAGPSDGGQGRDTALSLAGLVAEVAARSVGERKVASLLSARRAQRAGRFVPTTAPADEPAPVQKAASRHRSQPWAVAAPELTRARNARARRLGPTWTASGIAGTALLAALTLGLAPVPGFTLNQNLLVFALAASLACLALLTPYLLPTRARLRVRVASTQTAPLALRGTTLYVHSPSDGIDLTRPFVMELTRNPVVVADASLLGVVVSQTGTRGENRRVRFCVPIQSRDLDGLTGLTLDAPVLEAAPFAQWLWPALRYHAALHGHDFPRSAEAPA